MHRRIAFDAHPPSERVPLHIVICNDTGAACAAYTASKGLGTDTVQVAQDIGNAVALADRGSLSRSGRCHAAGVAYLVHLTTRPG
jgi:hypothetical protein